MKMKDRIIRWHKQGLWDENKLRNAVEKKWLTADEFKEITGKKFK